MKKIFALLLLFPIVTYSYSSAGVSQKRFPNESFKDALQRMKMHLPKSKLNSLKITDLPVSKKLPLSKMDFSLATEVGTYQELIRMFHVIRDSRFLHTNNNPDFERRIAWLYPDDGCFARAALSGIKLNDEVISRPTKIFVFGDLVYYTPYSPDGAVNWWYHVSLVVKYMGVYYVLDPALNQEGPLFS